MKFGTGFPLIALNDVGAARDFAQTYDGAGFDYLTAAGHLLATTADRYEGRPPMTFAGPFIDPFVLFGYLSGQTSRIHFVTSILILPLYETAVVAKQAAELDFVSGGRFELGVGISWQEAEYRAVGQDVHRRGARLGEQVEVLKLFWTKPYFSFKGKFHDIDNMGLNKLPSKPIPLWFGSTLEEAPVRRAAKHADGWMPMADPTETLPRFKQYMTEAGRNPSSLQLMSRVTAGDGGPDAWISEGKRLQGIGATHLTIGAPPDLTGAAASQRIIEAKNALSGALG
ncbi:MAG TPA: TIGR03619 family F420-dependent LLM class oxidoreductase [Dehalococcoidia bacterium]|jgi:probable F420-dependent oxidoreductase|nr:TIGR03619 family F420-dependent LLM class oxidoreductase [Dehalococcoidia bacterium]